jgi:L-fuconolactonase
MRIDAHHHFWQIGRYEYPWIGPDGGVLARDYGPAELAPLLASRQIARTVLVQTIASLDETRWFLSLARENPWIAGVVGWVDLTDPAVGDTLDELLAGPGLVGIRHNLHEEPDPHWVLWPDVQRGLGEVARRGLVYDLLIRPPYLAAALDTARRLPELRLVVDHLAKPAIARRGWDDWAGPLAELAREPNVWCKLSGMITEADHRAWTPADLRPYVEHVLDSFGPQRAMFGSDWPVCLLAGSYAHVVDALEENLACLSSAERAAVMGENAAACYGLSGPEAPP